MSRNSWNRKWNIPFKKNIVVDSLKEDQKEFIKNNKLILRTQHRFQNERHSVFTEETNKIALSSNDDKIMQPIKLIEIYEYGMNENLVLKKEELICNNIIKQHENY